MSEQGVKLFYPISDSEWDWVCSVHGRHCETCPRFTCPVTNKECASMQCGMHQGEQFCAREQFL